MLNVTYQVIISNNTLNIVFHDYQLTNFKRQTFSLKAPIQPVNPRINMIPPTIISAKAGSITMSLKKS